MRLIIHQVCMRLTIHQVCMHLLIHQVCMRLIIHQVCMRLIIISSSLSSCMRLIIISWPNFMPPHPLEPHHAGPAWATELECRDARTFLEASRVEVPKLKIGRERLGDRLWRPTAPWLAYCPAPGMSLALSMKSY